MPGAISQTFQKKIAKKSVTSRGMNLAVSGPSIGRPMFSWTNCTPISAKLWSLPGTTFARRSPKKKNATIARNPRQHDEEHEVHAELEAADLEPGAPAIPDEVVGGRRLERGEHGSDGPDHRRASWGSWKVQRSPCMRPESSFISTISSATVAGTRAARKATIENHASCCRSTMTRDDDAEPQDESAERDHGDHDRRDGRGPGEGPRVGDEVRGHEPDGDRRRPRRTAPVHDEPDHERDHRCGDRVRDDPADQLALRLSSPHPVPSRSAATPGRSTPRPRR